MEESRLAFAFFIIAFWPKPLSRRLQKSLCQPESEAAEAGTEAKAFRPVRAAGAVGGSTAKAGASTREIEDPHARQAGVLDRAPGMHEPGKKEVSGARLDQRRGGSVCYPLSGLARATAMHGNAFFYLHT